MFCVPLETSCGAFKALPVSSKKARKDLAYLSKGLAHPTRVKIVSMLARLQSKKKITCSEIVAEFPHAQSAISQHLKVLKQAGWVKTSVEYPRIFYSLTDGVVEYYGRFLCSCTARFPE